MPADKRDFEIAQEIHELLIDVADQGSKDDALDCHAMIRLGEMLGAQDLYDSSHLTEFLFRCAIAVQFGPVEAVEGEGARAGDAPTWGDDTLSQMDRDTSKRIIEMTEAYEAHHSEGPIELAPEDKDDENQGMT